jgi:hypothetical protein
VKSGRLFGATYLENIATKPPDLYDVLQSDQALIKFENSVDQIVRYFDAFRYIYEGHLAGKRDENLFNSGAILFSSLQGPFEKDVAIASFCRETPVFVSRHAISAIKPG